MKLKKLKIISFTFHRYKVSHTSDHLSSNIDRQKLLKFRTCLTITNVCYNRRSYHKKTTVFQTATLGKVNGIVREDHIILISDGLKHMAFIELKMKRY